MYRTISEPGGHCPLGSCLQTDSLTFGGDPHFKKGTDIHVLFICSVEQTIAIRYEGAHVSSPRGAVFFWGFRLFTCYENIGQGQCV